MKNEQRLKGLIDSTRNIKKVHDAIVIEWENGEIEALWGKCKDRVKEALND